MIKCYSDLLILDLLIFALLIFNGTFTLAKVKEVKQLKIEYFLLLIVAVAYIIKELTVSIS